MKTKKLHLDLTNECNLVCSYCYVHSREKDSGEEMDCEDWLKIINQAIRLGIRDFTISGGEPLLFPGISKIIRRLDSYQVKISLMTNLWKTNDEVWETIIGSPALKTVVVSLDGFEGHNIARPPSKWQDIIEALRRLREDRKDLKISVNTVLHKYNAQEIETLYDKVVELGVDVWRLDIPIKPKRLDILLNFRKVAEIAARLIIKRYACSSLQKIDLVLFRIYKSQLENIQVDAALKQNDTSLHPCDYFLGALAIKPNGAITLCSPMQLALGKVDSGANLKDALTLVETHDFFSLKVSDLQNCKNCKYLLLCGGGCRADALRWTGSERNADPIACLTMPLLEEVILPVLSTNLKEVYTTLIQKDGEPPRYKNLAEVL